MCPPFHCISFLRQCHHSPTLQSRNVYDSYCHLWQSHLIFLAQTWNICSDKLFSEALPETARFTGFRSGLIGGHMFGSTMSTFSRSLQILHSTSGSVRPLAAASTCNDCILHGCLAVTLGQNLFISNTDCWPWRAVTQTRRVSCKCARRRPTPWCWSSNVALSSGKRFTRWRHFKQ